MKIVFFGTPDYVLPILKAVHKKFVTGPGKSPIVAVVTQGPKPVGRKQIIEYSPIDKWAHERGINTFYEANYLIDNHVEADLGILAAHGEIIRQPVIDLFKYGILVVHPSLLPKFRGASPIQSAIATGKTETGVSIFKMDEKVDHGKLVTQFKEDILPTDTNESLRAKLFEKTAKVIIEMIEPYMKGKIAFKTQDESKVSFTRMIRKEDSFIPLEYLKAPIKGEWKLPFIEEYSQEITPETIERFVRAMYPWPGAWTLFQDKRLKILKAHLEESKLVLDEVQLEGKTPISWKQFVEAYSPQL